ncbi:MAG: nucleotidyltransferase family protein [Actinomycetota bacterium]|nr:nucleotidyltransferase family protein [Actinomycetota bacterium]
MPEKAEFGELVEVMKKSAGVLREAEVPFLLAGGIASWARGGPESDHDVDFLVKPEDAERALDTLSSAGMRPDRPPEGWLFKAWEDEAFVDLIFETSEGPVSDAYFDRSEELEVYAVRMRVASLDDVLVTKLLALNEMDLDYGSVLEMSRAVREQVDWDHVRERTKQSPYAKAFFTLVEELGVAERSAE